MGKLIACIGDSSDHGGTVISHNQDGKLTTKDVLVAVEGALHSCPIEGHGTTAITAITKKSFHNNKLILTEQAQAGCGAKLIPESRNVFVE